MPTPAERAASRKPRPTVHTARAVVWRCRVRAFRRRLGLSLRDVRNETGVSDATLCHMERGCETTLGHAVAVAKFFGVPVESLWSRRGGK